MLESVEIQSKKTSNSLSSLEGEVVVLLPVAPVQLFEVEGLREEVVDEGAEGDAVGPARSEVGDLNSLRRKQAMRKYV